MLASARGSKGDEAQARRGLLIKKSRRQRRRGGSPIRVAAAREARGSLSPRGVSVVHVREDEPSSIRGQAEGEGELAVVGLSLLAGVAAQDVADLAFGGEGDGAQRQRP